MQCLSQVKKLVEVIYELAFQEMIPKQLRGGKFRFIKIKIKSKVPSEYSWTEKNNYSWNDEALQNHINNSGNYGVATGFGDLLVIDCDDLIAEKIAEENLPETFTVLTGSGRKHFYYICDNGKNLKIFRNNEKETLSDIQFKGKQVIGPGSIHPNGGQYKVIKDIPIAKLDYISILYCFSNYLQYSHQVKKRSDKRQTQEKDRICKEIKEKISMDDLLAEAGISLNKNPTDCPWHTSTGGKCFSYTNETFHCFHCEESGSLFDFYMKWRGVGFLTAKKELADLAGVQTDQEIAEEEGFLFNEFKSNENFIEKAKRLIAKQPIWYNDNKTWWVWNYKEYKWVLKDETDIMNAIDTYTKTPSTNSMIKNEWLEALKRIGRKNKPKPIPNTWVQFKDTIIDIKSNETFQANPEYFVTNPIPWELGEIDYTPTIDILFKEWVGEEYVQTLYEIIAYSMLSDYPIHRLFCLIGSGLNGKSCFLKLLENFLGDGNITSIELDTLINSRFEITRLHRKLICVMGETNFKELERTSIIKKLTSGDVIGFEYKNRDPFIDKNYAKIIMATNNLPSTSDKTLGFYRRWLIIDFPNTFTEKLDVMQDISIDEYKGLARKSIMVLKELLEKREFHNEGDIHERERRYEERSNPFDKFWKDFIIEDYNNHVPKHKFKEIFEEWCRDNRFRKITDRMIVKHMKERNIEDGREQAEWYSSDGKRPTIRVWYGIKLKDEP